MGGKKTVKLFMGGFLAVLMVFSFAGIIGSGLFSSPPAPLDFEDNGITFRRAQQGYVTDLSGIEIGFSFLPSDIANISSERVTITGEKMYISKDPTNTVPIDLAVQRISGIAQAVGTRAVHACVTEDGCLEDIPIVECSNTSLTLQLRQGPVGIVAEDFNCYVLTAETDIEFYQLSEYITYSTFGVLP
jgi:hypothetical protein